MGDELPIVRRKSLLIRNYYSERASRSCHFATIAAATNRSEPALIDARSSSPPGSNGVQNGYFHPTIAQQSNDEGSQYHGCEHDRMVDGFGNGYLRPRATDGRQHENVGQVNRIRGIANLSHYRWEARLARYFRARGAMHHEQ